ncbi:SAG family member [Eimeria mitis]|uniref:SAG family member n=1 Tax=Eimeria mitis TaxID=44415 RepID=U6KE61_9EIME|nr:SAG family member [Eimeria mitis]CDJ36234.1 SAG family member [Eimeria mitis]
MLLLHSAGDAKHCTVEINKFRKQVDPQANNYMESDEGNPAEDLQSFLSTGGEYPAVFNEAKEPYTRSNAIPFVSLLSDKAEIIYCGTPKGCDTESIICYFKPSSIAEGAHPVSRQMWHKVEEAGRIKPSLEAHGDEYKDLLEAVNAVRTVKGLGLPGFTAPVETEDMKRRDTINDATPYENALYNLTCEEIKDSTIHPNVAQGYTLIYAINEGEDPPTAEEAVEFWKSGFTKLGTDVPPAFTVKKSQRTEGIDGTIYYDNAVAGFASMMVDGTREMRCYNATGCDNAAVICFLSEPTLVENRQPIRYILSEHLCYLPTF